MYYFRTSYFKFILFVLHKKSQTKTSVEERPKAFSFKKFNFFFFSLFFFFKFFSFILSKQVLFFFKLKKVGLRLDQIQQTFNLDKFLMHSFLKKLVLISFFFIFNTSVSTLKSLLEGFFSVFSKKQLSYVLKFLSSINFFFRSHTFRGFLNVFRGKLAWKALSRKQSSKLKFGQYGLLSYYLPSSESALNYSTVTGSVSLKIISFILFVLLPNSRMPNKKIRNCLKKEKRLI